MRPRPASTAAAYYGAASGRTRTFGCGTVALTLAVVVVVVVAGLGQRVHQSARESRTAERDVVQEGSEVGAAGRTSA